MHGMFALVVSTLLLAFLVYAVFVLFWNKNEEENTDINNFIVDVGEDGDESNTAAITRDRYCTRYEEPGKQLLILYGTEYGFSEELAKNLFDRFCDNGYQDLSLQPRVLNAKAFEMVDFGREQVLLCVFSTSGDGVPPTDARPFIDHLRSSNPPPSVSHLHYSVLALGDSNYPHYCRTGKDLDTRLSELGGQCLHRRVDIDQEDWPKISSWMEGVVGEVTKLDLKTDTDYLDLSAVEETGHSRTRPFLAEMTVKYSLTVMDSHSDKETIHAEFDLTGSDLTYTSGDALGIYPLNNPPEVEDVISALHCTGDEVVSIPLFCYSPKPEGEEMSLRKALTKYYDLKNVKPDLVKVLVEGVEGDGEERRRGERLLQDGLFKQNVALASYLSEREVVDVLMDFPSSRHPPQSILSLLKALQPRYYSIASSPLKDSVAVCAAVIRYHLHDRPRTGVCTTFLQDRVAVGETCPVFISHNPDFRLPSDGEVPIIMIGPGTGIAPFRAFIQERGLLVDLPQEKPIESSWSVSVVVVLNAAVIIGLTAVLSGARGENILYFGCRHKDKDFLYREELEKWVSDGVLHLRTAFSRDQPEKVYVQHLIRDDSKWLWKLIHQADAHIYVCGDAKTMAGDVHRALLEMVTTVGELGEEKAKGYLEELEEASRYQKDVWVT